MALAKAAHLMKNIAAAIAPCWQQLLPALVHPINKTYIFLNRLTNRPYTFL